MITTPKMMTTKKKGRKGDRKMTMMAVITNVPPAVSPTFLTRLYTHTLSRSTMPTDILVVVEVVLRKTLERYFLFF